MLFLSLSPPPLPPPSYLSILRPVQWSRFTGGSGAPGWTLEMVGFDMTKFLDTAAAIVHNTYEDPDNFPRMIWPTNYTKLATATMFTLFFAGSVFAPRCMVELRTQRNPDEEDRMITLTEPQLEAWKRGEFMSDYEMLNIGDYLQKHYFEAVGQLADRIALEEELLDAVVVGWDTLNEPSGGFIGFEDISITSTHIDLKNGLTPTPLQAMLLGEGVSCEVEVWDFSWRGPRKASKTVLNQAGERCWRAGYQCPWLSHGVYDRDRGVALKKDYFNPDLEKGKSLDWVHEYWRPFARNFTDFIRARHPKAIIFAEPPVNEAPPMWDVNRQVDRICYAPHWYDGITLMNKHFSPWYTVDYIGFKRGKYSTVLGALRFGLNGVKSSFASQLGAIREEGLAYMGKP